MDHNENPSGPVRSYEPVGIKFGLCTEIALISNATRASIEKEKVQLASSEWNFSVLPGFAIVGMAIKEALIANFKLSENDVACVKYIDLDHEYHLVGIGYVVLLRSEISIEHEEFILRFLDGICQIPLGSNRPRLPFDFAEEGALCNSVTQFLISHGGQPVKHPAWIYAGENKVYLFKRYLNAPQEETQPAVEVDLVGEVDGVSRQKREFVVRDGKGKHHAVLFDEAMFLKGLCERICDGNHYHFLIVRSRLPDGKFLDILKEVGVKTQFSGGCLI